MWVRLGSVGLPANGVPVPVGGLRLDGGPAGLPAGLPAELVSLTVAATPAGGWLVGCSVLGNPCEFGQRQQGLSAPGLAAGATAGQAASFEAGGWVYVAASCGGHYSSNVAGGPVDGALRGVKCTVHTSQFGVAEKAIGMASGLTMVGAGAALGPVGLPHGQKSEALGL